MADDGTRRERFREFRQAYPLQTALRESLQEHRWHVGFATALFTVGILIGIALAAAGVDLLELFMEYTGEGLFPEAEDEDFELTARFFIVNNTLPFLMSIVGAITLGVLPFWIMLFNGVVVGNLLSTIAPVVGVDYIVVGILPHGIFELPALFVAAGVGFRIVHRFGQRVLGHREAFITRRYVYRTGVLVLVAWVILLIAAVIEAHLTPFLLEELFAERLAEIQANETASPA